MALSYHMPGLRVNCPDEITPWRRTIYLRARLILRSGGAACEADYEALELARKERAA